jgi:hypothetical protein
MILMDPFTGSGSGGSRIRDCNGRLLSIGTSSSPTSSGFVAGSPSTSEAGDTGFSAIVSSRISLRFSSESLTRRETTSCVAVSHWIDYTAPGRGHQLPTDCR